MNRKQEIALLVVLLVIGGGIWGWQYLPSGGGSGDANNSSFLHGYRPLNFPDSKLHIDVTDGRRKAAYKPSGVNLFSMVVPPTAAEIKQNEENQRKAQEAQQAAAAQQQQQQETTVQIPPNLKFFGYGSVPNNTARRAFLEDGDQVYIVNEGDTLLGRYRILKINNASIEFEEIGSGRRGQKALEDQGPNA